MLLYRTDPTTQTASHRSKLGRNFVFSLILAACWFAPSTSGNSTLNNEQPTVFCAGYRDAGKSYRMNPDSTYREHSRDPILYAVGFAVAVSIFAFRKRWST